jgi:hypothetical protein
MAKKTKASVSKTKSDVSPTSAKATKPAAKTPAAKAPKPAAPKAATAAAKRKPPKSPAIENASLNSAVAAASYTLQQRFTSFDDAKSATIDALLEAIESAEARLVAAKRASTYAQLEQLTNSHP